MKRLVTACSAALLLPMTLAYACSPFSASTAPVDASAPPTSTALSDSATAARTDGGEGQTDIDAGADAAPGESTLTLPDGGGTANCWDFTQTKGDFKTTGKTTYRAGSGYTLVIESGGSATLARSFARPSTVTVTTAQIDATVTITGPALKPNRYVDALAQYYGTTPDFDHAVHNSVELVMGGTEIDAWSAAGDVGFQNLQVTDKTLAFSELNGVAWLDTVWAPSGGRIDLSAAGKTAEKNNLAVIGDTTSSVYTLEIGGSPSAADDPSVTIVVRSICVGFH